MSKINPGLYSSIAHDWQTPPDLIGRLLAFEERKRFTLDPCCTQFNVPADVYYTHPKDDGLILPWTFNQEPGLVFVNPPYGNALRKWMEKALHEHIEHGAHIWVLVPARTETNYQHEYGLTQAGFTVFLRGRLQFWKEGEPFLQENKQTGKMEPGVAPFPTMLLYYGEDAGEKAFRWVNQPPLPGTLMFKGDHLWQH